MPVLGVPTCQPVGPTLCPEGFQRDSSGFGCAPKFRGACSGATRETASGCAPVGDCVAPFPPAGANVFVDDSYTPNQLDATHFATVAAAIAGAPSGAVVAVEAGTYRDPLVFTRPVTVLGRCAEQVILDGGAATVAGLKVAGGVRDVTVRGVSLSRFEPGAEVSAGASLALEDSIVAHNRRTGAQVLDAGSRLVVRRSAIRGSEPDASARFGVGASAADGGELTLEDTAVVDTHEFGVFADVAGTTARLVRSVVRTIAPRTSGLFAVGVGAQRGAKLDLDQTVVDECAGACVNLAGASVEIRQSAILRIARAKTATGASRGAGLLATAQSTVLLEGVSVDAALGAALQLDTSTATVTDAALAGVAGGGGGLDALRSKATVTRVAVVSANGFAMGVRGQGGALSANQLALLTTRPVEGIAYAAVASDGGSLTLSRSTVANTTGTGLVVLGTGSRADVEGTLIDDTRLANDSLGVGALAEDGGELTLRASVVRASDALGVAVNGGAASLSGVLVRDTRGVGDGLSGAALFAVSGAKVTLEGAAFLDSALAGVLVGSAGTTVRATGLTVARTRFDAAKLAGRGVSVQDGAHVELTRAEVVDNGQAALGVFDATLRAVDSRLSASRKTDDDAYGHGAFAVGGRLDLDGVRVEKNPGVGVVFSGAAGTVRRSTIASNAVGIHVQEAELVSVPQIPDPPDAAGVFVSEDTRLVDNGTRVGSGEVPLPAPLKLDR